MKILRLLLIVSFFTVSLFSQPNYPEITQEELSERSYEIILETENYIIVEVEGKYYIFFFD